MGISIHAPRTGSDRLDRARRRAVWAFQSTLPARGATRHHGRAPCIRGISIHAPRTGSDSTCTTSFFPTLISIHAPRTGSDVAIRASMANLDLFQSTLPARGATPTIAAQHCIFRFQSTLPARGATFFPTSETIWKRHFNPRSPHGERPHTARFSQASYHFNPRSPHGERRVFEPDGVTVYNFNPRSPHGERHVGTDSPSESNCISIHAPRTGSDPPKPRRCVRTDDFNPRSPHGERRDSAGQ